MAKRKRGQSDENGCRLLLIGLLAAFLPIRSHAQVPAHPRLIVVNQDLHGLTHPSGSWETWTERQRASVLAYRSIILAAEDLCRLHRSAARLGREHFVDQQTAFYHNIKTLAMAHLLRRGEPYDNAYLDYACRTLDYIRTTGYPMWYTTVDPYNTDLNTGELLAGWALAFDWLYQDMTPAQVSNNIEALFYLLDNQDYAHVVTGLNDNNHIAVCFGGRGLACLALETHCTPQQETSRSAWLTEATKPGRRLLRLGVRRLWSRFRRRVLQHVRPQHLAPLRSGDRSPGSPAFLPAG